MADDRARQAMNEIVDLQASMDPTRSECVRPTILDHFHRWMRAPSMIDKYMELDGLIRACLPHMGNPRAVADVLERLDDPILRQDILTKNTDLWLANVPIGVIELNECWVRYPRLADIWDIVQKDLVRSGLLPWALSYPERALDSYIYGRLMERIEEKRLLMEREKFGAERPQPLLPQPVIGRPDEATLPETHETPTLRDEDLKLRSVPMGPRPEQLDHAAYMAQQLGALHEEVETTVAWTPDELPVPPAEIGVAAKKVKRVVARIPKKGW